MSLKSIIATPLFLIVAATAGAAEQTRQTTIVQDMATGAAGAAKPTPAGSQRYVDVPPGNFIEPPTPEASKLKNATGGIKLPAVQKVRDAANRNTQADKHRGEIEIQSFSLGATDQGTPGDGKCTASCSNNLKPGDRQQRGQTHHAGGVLVGMGDGSVRNSVSSVGSNETISIGSNSTESAKGGGVNELKRDDTAGGAKAPRLGSLGSLQGMGSIGQLAVPQGADQAAGREVRHRMFSIVDRTAMSKDGAGTGKVGSNETIKIGGGRTETTAGGGPNVRVFSGNDGAAGVKPGSNITMKGSTIRQN